MIKIFKQLIFVSLSIAIILAGGYQQYGSGRPVAWWKMDEASFKRN